MHISNAQQLDYHTITTLPVHQLQTAGLGVRVNGLRLGLGSVLEVRVRVTRLQQTFLEAVRSWMQKDPGRHRD